VIALPKALVVGILFTIYHLAKAILWEDSRPRIEATLYHACRDLMEGFGWLATLINDAWGSRLVDRCRFEKECYAAFFAERPARLSLYFYQGDILDTKLTDFAASRGKKGKLPASFLQHFLPSLRSLQMIVDSLRAYDADHLEKCQLRDLFMGQNYMHYTDAQILSLKISDLSDPFYTEAQLSLIRARLFGLTASWACGQDFPGNDPSQLTLAQFVRLKPALLTDTYPDIAYSFVSDKQLSSPQFNLLSLNTAKKEACLMNKFGYEKESARRSRLLHLSQLQALAESEETRCISWSADLINKLNASSRVKWQRLLSCCKDAAVAELKIEILVAALKSSFFKITLSDAHLRALPLSQLSKSTISVLFSVPENKVRRALLNPEEVRQAKEKKLFDSQILSHFN
jgi:hypothetical protein